MKINREKEQFFLNLVREGFIRVDKDGSVWNIETGRKIGFPVRGGRGGFDIGWKSNGKLQRCKVNRLVWLVHVGPIPDGLTPRYKDRDPCNNALDNLELGVFDTRATLSLSTAEKYPKKYGTISSLSNEDFALLISDSLNVTDVLRKLDICRTGNSWCTIKRRIEDLNLSIEHFVTPVITKGFALQALAPEVVLTSNSIYATSTARSAFKRFKCIPYKCAGTDGHKCHVTDEWGGEPLTLHLDHIDGDSRNHLPSNLRWLCPNCHSQTPTYGGRNTSNPKRRKT